MNDKNLDDEIMKNSADDEREMHRKEREIRKSRVDDQHEMIQERKRAVEKVNSINVSVTSDEKTKERQEENIQYLTLARKSKVFLTNTFKGSIPYFGRNLITCCARSGSGKSTIAANLGHRSIIQGDRVFHITNEENASDVFNRITCLIKGESYADHTQFTDAQIHEFARMQGILSQRITVIDDAYHGEMGLTSTIEGMESILPKAIASGEYDVIIIDYYQNVNVSMKVPSMKDFEVQARFVKLLDQCKNQFNGPIIVLAQLKDNTDSFKDAIEGRKTIYNASTCVIEVVRESDKMATSWHIHKSRFADSVGKIFYTGFKMGKYVEYNDDFRMQAEKRMHENRLREARESVKLIGNDKGRDGEDEGKD